MTEEQGRLVKKAAESIAAARVLLREGYADFAASRAYYAMFYAAQALLLEEGLTFSSHSGTIAGFGQHLAKPRKVPDEYHRMLIDAQDLRELGDYGMPNSVGVEQAREQIVAAE